METSNRPSRIDNLSIDAKWERLFTACSNGKTKDIEEILQCTDTDAFINKQKGFYLYSPLHNLVLSKCDEKCNMMELLLSHGANPSLQCSNAFTPLHLAASIGDVESIKALLKFNADFTLTDDFNQTPLKIAEKRNHKSAAMHLRTAGKTWRALINKRHSSVNQYGSSSQKVVYLYYMHCLQVQVNFQVEVVYRTCKNIFLHVPDRASFVAWLGFTQALCGTNGDVSNF